MKTLRLSGLILAAAVLATASSQSQTVAQTIQVNKNNRTIAITATDKVIVMADTATVHIGFIAYGPDSDAAYATGSRISNVIVTVLTAAGVPSDAIESENQYVSPVQEYQIDKLTPAEKAQRKFQVVQSWTVRTRADDAAIKKQLVGRWKTPGWHCRAQGRRDHDTIRLPRSAEVGCTGWRVLRS